MPYPEIFPSEIKKIKLFLDKKFWERSSLSDQTCKKWLTVSYTQTNWVEGAVTVPAFVYNFLQTLVWDLTQAVNPTHTH